MTETAASHRATFINVPEAVGVFDSFGTLQAAVYGLWMQGFSRADISLLGDKDAMEETLGSAYWRSADLEDNPDAPRAAFVSEEATGKLEGAIAAGFFFVGSAIAMAAMLTPLSTLAGSVAAIAIGCGPAGVLGALLARRAAQHHKEYYSDQIRKGGIPLWGAYRCRGEARPRRQDPDGSFRP